LLEGDVIRKPEVRDPRFAELDRLIAQDDGAAPGPRSAPSPPAGISPPSPVGVGSASGAPQRGERPSLGVQRPSVTTATVEGAVGWFADYLKERFASRVKRRPKSLKHRVLALFRVQLPPYPKAAGRPRLPRITKAVAMYREQQQQVRRGERKAVNWDPIALECSPGFKNIKSQWRRTATLNTLRNAVYGRLKGMRRKKRPKDSSDEQTAREI